MNSHIVILLAFLIYTSSTVAAIRYASIPPLSSTPIVAFDKRFELYENKPLAVSVAKNEWSYAGFVLYSEESFDSLTVNTTECLNEKGKAAGSADLNIKYVKKWYQSGTAWNDHYQRNSQDRKLVPELILKDFHLVRIDPRLKTNFVRVYDEEGFSYVDVTSYSSAPVKKGSIIVPIRDFNLQDADILTDFHLDSGDVQQIWVEVIPKGVRLGEKLVCDINILSGSQLQLTIPVTITVHKFELSESPVKHYIYYRSKLAGRAGGTISSELKSESQLIAEMVNLKLHGIDCPTIYQNIEENDQAFRRYMDIWSSFEFCQGKALYLGSSAEYSRNPENIQRQKRLDGHRQLAKAYDLQWYLYGKDEAKGSLLKEQLYSWRIARNNGFKIFSAGYADQFELGQERADIMIVQGTLNRGKIEAATKLGATVFVYQKPQSGPENPYLFRYMRGIYLYQIGVDGSMDYAYQHSMGFIWDDFDHIKYRDHAFVYPTANGIIDTLAWKGHREGKIDLKYLFTLISLIERAKVESATVNAAKDFIMQVRHGKFDDNLDAFRIKCVYHINQLL